MYLVLLNVVRLLLVCVVGVLDVVLFQSLPPFAASNNFKWEVSRLYALHAWLSSGSSRCACLDLDLTEVAYSATE